MAILDRLVDALVRAADMRDSYADRHSEELARLVREVGARLGLEEPELPALQFAARLHDLGKIGVPDQILRKPGPLTEHEWDVMRKHPRWGADMLANIPGLEDVAQIVATHHERYDGGGYPDGLRGEEIPLAGRVLAACDAYQAMVADRPYRPALGRAEALRELREAAGTQFDPGAVEALSAAVCEPAAA